MNIGKQSSIKNDQSPALASVYDYQRYGIACEQLYKPADGSTSPLLEVVNVDKFAKEGRVVVQD